MSRGVVYASILTREASPPDGLSRHRVVLLNCHDAEGRLSSIVPAERRGGEAATEVLLDGRAPVASPSSPASPGWRRRVNGRRASSALLREPV